eukprot:scaffold19611_cov67-Cyclotella_meneghiniana.AAC.7
MSVTVLVELTTPRTTEQTVALCLYIHDTQICDAPAALAASCDVQIPKGESSVEVIMNLDMTVKQVGRTWKEMITPSIYVALDIEKSSVTYCGGPTFQLQPGSLAILKVKAKV